MNRWFTILCLTAWLGVLAWAGTIFYLSTMTGPEVERALPFKVWDKALHFLAFSTGAFLVAAALRLSAGWGWRRILPLTLFLISAYGAADEWHQTFTPGRSGLDLGDWSADTLGALAGALLCCALSFHKARRRPTPSLP